MTRVGAVEVTRRVRAEQGEGRHIVYTGFGAVPHHTHVRRAMSKLEAGTEPARLQRRFVLR
jgi:hypothetical protein